MTMNDRIYTYTDWENELDNMMTNEVKKSLTVKVKDNTILNCDDKTITGKQFKLMLDVLEDLTKDKYPEEFL